MKGWLSLDVEFEVGAECALNPSLAQNRVEP